MQLIFDHLPILYHSTLTSQHWKFSWSGVLWKILKNVDGQTFFFRRTLVQKCYGRGFNGLVPSDMYLISSYRISKGGINMHVKVILLFLCFFQVNSCPSGQRRRSRPQNGLTPRQDYQIPPYTQVDYFLPSSLLECVTILVLSNFWIHIPQKSLSITRFPITIFFFYFMRKWGIYISYVSKYVWSRSGLKW